jgi:hypothetical protein
MTFFSLTEASSLENNDFCSLEVHILLIVLILFITKLPSVVDALDSSWIKESQRRGIQLFPGF